MGLGTDFWNHSILILPQHNNQLDAEFFGLSNLSAPELQSFWNSTYSQRWIKLLPFFSSLTAVVTVCLCFSHGTLNNSHKTTLVNVLNAPYFSNQKIMLRSDKSVLLNILRPASNISELSSAEVTRLINLYTPAGFLERMNEQVNLSFFIRWIIL